jgi:hypothetical protein
MARHIPIDTPLCLPFFVIMFGLPELVASQGRNSVSKRATEPEGAIRALGGRYWLWNGGGSIIDSSLLTIWGRRSGVGFLQTDVRDFNSGNINVAPLMYRGYLCRLQRSLWSGPFGHRDWRFDRCVLFGGDFNGSRLFSRQFFSC